MSFDHSNKPEGATHIIADTYGLSDRQKTANARCFYRMKVVDVWYGFAGGKWHAITCPEVHRYQRIPTQWTGEGLPPVGTVCECNHSKPGVWMEVEVVAHFNGGCSMVAAYTYKIFGDNRQVAQAIADCFRPIRTPEQIAVEDRKNDIQEMMDLFKEGKLGYFYAAGIYDAGYRKQVTD